MSEDVTSLIVADMARYHWIRANPEKFNALAFNRGARKYRSAEEIDCLVDEFVHDDD